MSCVGAAAAALAVWRTGEPAPYPCGRSRQRRRRGVPCGSSSMASRAPSPIERTRRLSVSPRQASSGEVGCKPAATNSRHRSSTGAYPRVLMPSASQRSAPTRVARTGACANCSWRLFSGMTCRPSWSIPEAPDAATAPGLFIVVMAYFLALELSGGPRAGSSAGFRVQQLDRQASNQFLLPTRRPYPRRASAEAGTRRHGSSDRHAPGTTRSPFGRVILGTTGLAFAFAPRSELTIVEAIARGLLFNGV